jgi:hypothetical protein
MPSAGPAPSTASAASPRIALARVALEAALAAPNVVAGDPGIHGLRVTADPGAGLLRGVSVTAERDGRYSVDLALVARMTPLLPLGETVRQRVFASARRQGFAGDLAAVNVEFVRLLAAGDDRPAALTPPADGDASAPPQSSGAAGPPRSRPDEEVRR